MEIVGTASDAAVEIYLRPTLVAMVTKIWEFLCQICYNSAYTRDIAENLAPFGIAGVF